MGQDEHGRVDIDEALVKTLSLYTEYVELTKYSGGPILTGETVWQHNPEAPLSLVIREAA